MPSRRSMSWRSFFRRLIAVGALLAYLAAVNGVPLPPPVVIKDGGKPFPCQGHACGCQTAEECWRHCCCHTPEERWAWAEENHVTPPDYAEKPAAKIMADLFGARAAAAPVVLHLCCTPESAEARMDSCVSAETNHEADCPCCKGSSSSPNQAAPSRHSPLETPVFSRLHCHGLTTLWVTTGTVPSDLPSLAPRPEPATTGRVFHANVSARRFAPSPPFHPPRVPFSV